MDESNFTDLRRMIAIAGADTELRMFRSFDPALAGVPEPDPRLDVPDPYYGGPADFEAVLQMVEQASDGGRGLRGRTYRGRTRALTSQGWPRTGCRQGQAAGWGP